MAEDAQHGREDEHPARDPVGRGIGAGGVGDHTGQIGPENPADAPGREQDTVVQAEVLGPPVVGRRGREEGQARAVVEAHQSGAEQEAGRGREPVEEEHDRGLEQEDADHSRDPADEVGGQAGQHAPAGVEDGQYGDEDEAGLDRPSRLGRDDLGDVADDHEAGRRAAGELRVEGPEPGRPDHFPPSRVDGRGGRPPALLRLEGRGACPDLARLGIDEELGRDAGDDEEHEAERPEGAGDALGREQGPGERRDIDRRQTEPGHDDAGDEAFPFRPEPLDRRRRRRGVPQADARAGEDAEAGDEGPAPPGRAEARDDEAEA